VWGVISAADEVLIATNTSGVGAMGCRHARRPVSAPTGRRPRFPLMLGTDGSGTIAAVGARIRRFAVGDPVYAACRRLPTCVRERWSSTLGSVFRLLRGYVAVSAEGVAHLPMGLDDALELQRGQAVVIPWRRRRGAALNESPLLPSGFRLFPL
jgi:NADPH:quinone reductase-like Zn-dependent oxidoreductase